MKAGHCGAQILMRTMANLLIFNLKCLYLQRDIQLMLGLRRFYYALSVSKVGCLSPHILGLLMVVESFI